MSFSKAIQTALLAIGIPFGAYCYYILYGLDLEARRSEYYKVFHGISERAIQMDRLGYVGWPVHSDNKIDILLRF